MTKLEILKSKRDQILKLTGAQYLNALPQLNDIQHKIEVLKSNRKNNKFNWGVAYAPQKSR